MLTRLGGFNEKALVKAARKYINLYGDPITGKADVPYKEQGSGLIHYIQFQLRRGKWIYIGIKA